MASLLQLWRWVTAPPDWSPTSAYRITVCAAVVVVVRPLFLASFCAFRMLTCLETSITLRRCRNVLFFPESSANFSFLPLVHGAGVEQEVLRYWCCQRLALAAAQRFFPSSKADNKNPVAELFAASLELPWWGLDPLLRRWLEGGIVYSIDDDVIRTLLQKYFAHRTFHYSWWTRWRSATNSFECWDEAILCLGSLAVGSLLFSIGRSLVDGKVAAAIESLEGFHNLCYPLHTVSKYGKGWRYDTAQQLLCAFRRAFDFLWKRIKQERRRSVWTLCCYLSRGAVEQAWVLSAAYICAIMAGSVEATTIALESELAILLAQVICRGGRGMSCSKNTNIRYVVSLLGMQCTCAAAASTLRQVASLLVKNSCAFQRARVKRRLFEALVTAPRAFLDRLSEDNVEELLYSVNDMEGVELHVLSYVTSLVRHVVSFYVVCRRNPNFPWASASSTILLLLWIRWGSSEKIRLWLRWNRTTLREEENGMMGIEEGVSAPLLLSGVDILAQVSLLRPLGADKRLMDDWIFREFGKKNSQFCHFFLMRRTLRLLEEGHVATATINALINTLSNTHVLDAAVVAWHGTLEGKSVTMLRHALQNFARSLLDTRRVVDIIMCHAYKAAALERALCSGHATSRGVTIVEIQDGDPRALSIENVSFAYPSRPERSIFQSFTLRIPLSSGNEGGNLVVLKGRNGGGKSTLLKLISSAYEVCSGSITLLLPRKEIDPTSIVPHICIAYVPQYTTIFEGSVAENVAMRLRVTLTDVDTLRRVERVMQRVGLGQMLQLLPEGAMTKLAPDGTRGSDALLCLSGGQQQRLSIARALYVCEDAFPALVVLDEPTASMDETSGDVLDLIVEMTRHSAVLCASHDEKLIKMATQVIELDGMESR